MKTAAERFHQLLADDWEFRMQDSPIWASMTGDHRFDDQMPDGSEAAAQRRLVQYRQFAQTAAEIGRDRLGEEDRLNYDIYTRLLHNDMRRLEFRAYRFPIRKSFSTHTMLPSLHGYMSFETAQDYDNYIARLQGIKPYLAQVRETMRAGLDDGQIPPRVTLEGVVKSIATHLVDDPAESVFLRPFQTFPAAVSADEQARLWNAGKHAVTESVIPAYAALGAFVRDEYMPEARESIGASELPNGRAYYEFCIENYTSLKLMPEEIHETGLQEVKRIRAEMEAIMAETGFEGDFKAFVAFLRSDQRFYVETAEELLKEVGYLMKRVDGQLPRLFKTLPRLPYGIREIPAYAAPNATTAYYQRGAGDGTVAGYYYVNTYDLGSRPLYEMEALSLHEAVPGHHLQIALQQELDLPNFRRFGGFTAFVEGWALYAERLGLEMGFFTDPYSNFGRLSYEMWRACRLVVDPGIHALGWTRQQAIDFMLENTSLTELNIVNEVDRYIGWPGQALAYKIGELKIRELRGRAEAALGDKFDIREFHHVLLTSGAVPLDVLEEMVGRWIEGEKVESRE